MDSFFIVKQILYFVILSLDAGIPAQQLVIFQRNEICSLSAQNPVCHEEEITKRNFINNFSGIIKSDRIEDIAAVRLETPPLDWGRKVNDDTYGQLVYQLSFLSGFVTDVHLYHLAPEHHYVLTLNGNASLDGNDLLPTPVPNNPQEKYYDFLDVSTDKKGEYHASLGIFLKPGRYHVRFYVKDPDDYRIVLFHDYFKFSVN